LISFHGIGQATDDAASAGTEEEKRDLTGLCSCTYALRYLHRSIQLIISVDRDGIGPVNETRRGGTTPRALAGPCGVTLDVTRSLWGGYRCMWQ
jgi:hypothetical protein